MTDSYTATIIASNTYTEVTATEIASNGNSLAKSILHTYVDHRIPKLAL